MVNRTFGWGQNKVRKLNESPTSYIVNNIFNEYTLGTYRDSAGYFFVVEKDIISMFDNSNVLLHTFVIDDLDYSPRL